VCVCVCVCVCMDSNFWTDDISPSWLIEQGLTSH